jgi:hypothetical protein
MNDSGVNMEEKAVLELLDVFEDGASIIPESEVVINRQFGLCTDAGDTW